MKKHFSQKGSMEATIMICLVLALITALGWIFWQNFVHKAPDIKATETSVVNKKNPDIPQKQVELKQDVKFNPVAVVSSKSDLSKLTDVSDDFKEFINTKYLEKNVGYGTECQAGIMVERVYKQSFALGGFGVVKGECAGGARMIWAKSGTTWIEVDSTQNAGFDCAKLKKYTFPSVLAGNECSVYTNSNNQGSVQAYTQE
jgi:hypothetical protein